MYMISLQSFIPLAAFTAGHYSHSNAIWNSLSHFTFHISLFPAVESPKISTIKGSPRKCQSTKSIYNKNKILIKQKEQRSQNANKKLPLRQWGRQWSRRCIKEVTQSSSSALSRMKWTEIDFGYFCTQQSAFHSHTSPSPSLSIPPFMWHSA